MEEITIIVVSNRYQKAFKCITNLLKQDYPNFKILIVWDGDLNGLMELEKEIKDKKIEIITNKGKGVSSGRNTGLEYVKSLYVAYTDDDCYPEQRWLRVLSAELKDGQYSGVGTIRVNKSNDLLSRLWQASYIVIGDNHYKYLFLSKHTNQVYLCTSSALFMRKVISSLGGFNELLVSGEDYDLSQKLISSGKKIKLVESVTVEHEHPQSLKSLASQQIWYGKGDYQIFLNRKSSFIKEIIYRLSYCNLLNVFRIVHKYFKWGSIIFSIELIGLVSLMSVARTYGFISMKFKGNTFIGEND